MSAYTEGPWVVENRVAVRGKNHTSICDCITTNCNYTASEANARLIAAAPDLLEALRAMVRDFGDCEQEDMDGADVIKTARAAIARAEGRP